MLRGLRRTASRPWRSASSRRLSPHSAAARLPCARSLLGSSYKEARMSEPARAVKIRLGDVVVAQKVITAAQLAQALEQQKRTGRRLGRILVEGGMCTEEQIAEAVARQLGIPYVNLKFANVDNEVVRRLPESQARRFRAIVL